MSRYPIVTVSRQEDDMARHSDWDFFGIPFGFGFAGSGDRGSRHRRRWQGQWFASGDMKYVILKLVRDKPPITY